MGNTTIIPQLQKTKIGAELDYQQMLLEEENRLQSELSHYVNDSKSMSDIVLQKKASIKILEIQNQIKQNKEIQKSIDFDEAARLQETMENMRQEIKRKAQEMSLKAKQYSNSTDTDFMHKNPEEAISQIENQKAIVSKISNDLKASTKQAKADSDKYFEMQKAEILNAEYRTAEKVKGVPTQEAIDRRTKQIKTLQIQTNEEFLIVQRQLEDSVASQMDSLIESIIDGYKHLESSEFVLVPDNNIKIKVDNYDGARKAWPVAIRFSLFGKQIGYDTYIPYQNILDTTFDEYEKYLDEVDLFEAYFSSIASPLNIHLTYSISPGMNPSQYLVIFKKLTLTRMDNGETVYSDKDLKEKMPPFDITVEPRYDLSKELEPYFKEKEAIVAKKEKMLAEKKIKATDWEYKKNSPKIYSRKTCFLDLGLASDLSSTEYSSEPGFMFSIKGYWPIAPYSYFGASLEYTGFYDSYTYSDYYSDSSVNKFTGGLSLLVGTVFPTPETSGIFAKGFGEIRFGLDSNSGNLITILGFGVESSGFEVGFNIQTSGENCGLCSLIFGIEFQQLWKLI